MQFAPLRNAVVVHVDPDAKPLEHRVARIDHPISVPALSWLVESCKRCIARRGETTVRKGSVVAEQFLSVVDCSVAIPIEHEESIPRAPREPREALLMPDHE
jgi:hypothetical protein